MAIFFLQPEKTSRSFVSEASALSLLVLGPQSVWPAELEDNRVRERTGNQCGRGDAEASLNAGQSPAG